MPVAYLVLLGIFLIAYGLFSLAAPDALIDFELRRLKRHPWMSWPFGGERYELYLRSARHRITLYAVGAGAILFGSGFVWAAGALRGLW